MMLTSATNFNDVSRETNDGRGGLQGGAIAAIVVGAMLAVLVVVEMVVGACVARRRYVDGGGGIHYDRFPWTVSLAEIVALFRTVDADVINHLLVFK